MSYDIITIDREDDLFPEAFRAIGIDCPDRIYAQGNIGLLKRDKIAAIIGSRKATESGLEAAYQIAADYASMGYVVVSGMALGCDTVAHRGCLSVGGSTIAVVATGLDRIYPKANTPLHDDILANGGLIISEYPPGTIQNPQRLVTRNRLQAALASVVVVAECPLRSGTMHTVNYAIKYGKAIRAALLPNQGEENSGNTHIISQGIGTAIDLR